MVQVGVVDNPIKRFIGDLTSHDRKGLVTFQVQETLNLEDLTHKKSPTSSDLSNSSYH